MGFIDDFKTKVEFFANNGVVGRDKCTGDGKIDDVEKESIFTNKALLNELKTACENDASVQQQVQDDLGISLSTIDDKIRDLTTSRARGLAGGGGNTTSDFSVYINIDINIVVNACNGSGSEKSSAIDQLIEKLLAAMAQSGGSIDAFMMTLISAFGSTNQVDFSSLETLLKEMNEKLDIQGKKIDALDDSINNLSKYLHRQFKSLFKTLKAFGINISNIQKVVEQCSENDTKMLTKLGQIYDAITRITGDINNMTAKFDNFTQIEQERYDSVVSLIGNLELNGDNTQEIMNKLELMHTLLLSIQGDTTETKTNSATLIDLVKQGNQNVLTAIQNINIIVNIDGFDGTEIKSMLTQILTNMTTKGDLDIQMNKFNQMIKEMETNIKTAIQEGNTEVLNAIADISTQIENIHIDGYNDADLRAWLSDMFANVATKGDFEVQLAKFNDIVKNLQLHIDDSIKKGNYEVLEAITNISRQIENVLLYQPYDDTQLKLWLDSKFANLVSKDDFSQEVLNFNTMLNNISTQIEQGDTKILNAIADISTKIDNINLGGYDDTKLREWLNQMFSKVLTEEDLNEAVTHFDTVIANLQKKVEEGDKNILDAIALISSKIDNINIDGYDDTKLRAWLSDMFANVATKGDFEVQLTNFNQMITTLQTHIDKSIKDGNKEVLEAIANISAKIDNINLCAYDDTKLRAWLSDMFANVATKADFETQLTKFNQMVTNLQTHIDKSIEDGNNEVLEAIANISAKIDNINLGGYDDTQLRAWLSDMFANVATKADFETQLTKFNQMVTNLQTHIDKSIKDGDTEILAAISTLSTKIDAISAQIEKINLEGYDDTALRTWLSDMFANVASKEDLNTAVTNFNTKLDNLETNIKTAIEEGKTEILNAIAGISQQITNLSIEGYDDTQLKAWLSDMFANVATKDDLSTQYNNIKTLIDNAKSGIETAIKNSETNILEQTDIIISMLGNSEPGDDNYTAVVNMFNSVMNKLTEMSSDNSKNFGDVLTAIANIKPGEPVDLTEVLALLRGIDATTKANGGKLDNVLNNQATIQLTLNGVVDGLTQIDGKVDGIKVVVDDIKDIVSKLHNCDCEHLDEVQLRLILKEFVEEIYKVVDEGSIDTIGARATTRGTQNSFADYARKLRSVLGLRAYDPTAVTSAKTDKFKEGVTYDLHGHVVEGPLKPGNVYILNGKKFIAK